MNAIIAYFRWVLDNEEDSSSKDAYKNSWLHIIYKNNFKNEETFFNNYSFVSEELQKIKSSVDDFIKLKA